MCVTLYFDVYMCITLYVTDLLLCALCNSACCVTMCVIRRVTVCVLYVLVCVGVRCCVTMRITVYFSYCVLLCVLLCVSFSVDPNFT